MEEKKESSKEIEKEEVSLEELFQKLDFIVEKIEKLVNNIKKK